MWYEGRVAGLGSEFARVVEAALMAVRRALTALAVVHGEVRQAVLRRFLYSLLFIPEADIILVLACFHHRRDPQTWQERL